MQVILTHEQADFDAIAASLGAHLLNESALPVLPRRMNRNVRAFLTLYGAELPYVEARDLPSGPIESVTLVDTQSLVTLKGMSGATKVHVVDHHARRPDLPEGWTAAIETVGASTTLFVEALHEHNGALSTLHASLLLLGIYEDTGSLTYASTTARDARATALLLEQGASLEIATRFLNPPLSEEQRHISDRLLASAEPHHVNGQNIIIAYTNAEDMTEEISSVAHKLRDLLDPDALFLLVQTGEGVRLVARSTTSQVDVSAVAAHFGGGGHERAAAALIRPGNHPIPSNQTLMGVYHELIDILPRFIRPAITVGRIMSRQPRLLQPDTPAAEAAALMQRYGYEGYPVVKDGRVIGLLTRRAVDRALAHKLNLPAASLMDSGEITVTPLDTIEQLQRVMTGSGWGQVPVIDPATQAVVGIVTRTDLLKNLAGGKALAPGKTNLAERLEVALPPARVAFLKLIAAEARELKMAVYIVGGFVRDLLLDLPSQDFDIVVEGDAVALARALSKRHGGRMTSHSQFGTAKWQVAAAEKRLAGEEVFAGIEGELNLPATLDLISARTEFYDYPTALPTVERSSIKHDLHRRDFTINTLALRLDGRHYGDLYDYWSGLSDLRQGLVRVLHSLSFVDDPTRLLRAVRFEQRFGFEIEMRTRELMDGARGMVRQVSGDRLRHEVNLILAEEKAPEMLARLQELELLTAIHPALLWDPALSEALRDVISSPPDPTWELPTHVGTTPVRLVLAYLTWLGQIPAAELIGIAERLHFSRPLHNTLLETSRLWKELPELRGAGPVAIVRQLDPISPAAQYAVHRLHPSAEARSILDRYARLLRHVQPYSTGHTLRELGLPPGPAYRAILERLRAGWLEGSITSQEEETRLLHELVERPPEMDTTAHGS